jgi:AAA15 family ATPase/GTPase
MLIKEISISNFKIWEKLFLTDLSKYNVIIGENNLGKSSIFDAVLSCIFKDKPKNISMIRRNEQGLTVKMNFDIHHPDLTKEVLRIIQLYDSIDNQPLTDFFLKTYPLWDDYEFFWQMTRDKINNKIQNDNRHLKKDNKGMSLLNKFIQNEYDRCPFNSTFNIGELVGRFNSVPEKAILDNLIYIPSRRNIKQELTLEQFNARYLRDGTSIKRDLFNAYISENQDIKGRFKNFQLIVDNLEFYPGKIDIVGQSGGNIDLIFRKEDETIVKIEELGDGTTDLLIIIAICVLHPNKIILIEEPELHLHPKAIHDLRNLFQYEFSNQIFISTHNPAFIGPYTDNTSVLKILAKDETPYCIQIQNHQELQDFRDEFDIRRSDFFFEHMLVFVEGPSDVKAFSHWFELLYPLNCLIKFVNCGGKDQIPNYLFLSLMCQLENDFLLFIIKDLDRNDEKTAKREIIEQLKKHNPEIFKIVPANEIQNKIYVLNKRNLEAYYYNFKVLSKWLNISEEEVQKELGSIKINDPARKLKKLGQNHGKSFKKNDVEDLLKLYQEGDVDAEIKGLFTFLLTKIQKS